MSLIDNEAMQYILGNRPDLAQKMVSKDVFGLTKMIPGVGNKAAAKVGRFAGRVAPALSAFQNVADVADIVTGEENLANKVWMSLLWALVVLQALPWVDHSAHLSELALVKP